MTAHQQNTIRAIFKGLQNQVRMYHPGAHNTNDSQIGGVLDTCGTRKVRRRIGTPVASEGQDLGLKPWMDVRQIQFLQCEKECFTVAKTQNIAKRADLSPSANPRYLRSRSSFKRSPDLRGKLAVRKTRYADSFLGACSLARAAAFAFCRPDNKLVFPGLVFTFRLFPFNIQGLVWTNVDAKGAAIAPQLVDPRLYLIEVHPPA